MYPIKIIFRSILLAFTLMSAITAMAQSRFYLKPSIGVGASTSEFHHKADRVLSYQITAGVGYRIKNVRLESGIGLLKLGTWETFRGGYIWSFERTISTNYYHLVLPVRLVYDIPVSHKILVQPAIGSIFSYNLHQYWRYKGSAEANSGISAEIQLNVAYKIDKTVELFGGPVFQYMSVNGSAAKWHYRGGRAYNAMFNAGVNIHLPERSKAADGQTR
jgi:hypothetical protein